MKGTHSVTLITLIVAVSAAAGSSFFAGQTIEHCFITGGAGYRIADHGPASYSVRIDNAAPQPGLRLQVVDDPATADFMLIDDSASASDCRDVVTVNSIRINAGGTDPDLTVSLSREPAEHRIYVRSANFSERDAAALFAVMWRNAQNGRSPTHKIASATSESDIPGR
jgi:hypothetical protein